MQQISSTALSDKITGHNSIRTQYKQAAVQSTGRSNMITQAPHGYNFQAAYPSIMTSHLIFSSSSPHLPATDASSQLPSTNHHVFRPVRVSRYSSQRSRRPNPRYHIAAHHHGHAFSSPGNRLYDPAICTPVTNHRRAYFNLPVNCCNSRPYRCR